MTDARSRAIAARRWAAPLIVAAAIGLVAIGAPASGARPVSAASTDASAAPGVASTAPSAVASEAGAGDTRSPGQGPGFVGAPLLAILGVLAIGLATTAVTLGYVRLTGGPREAPTSTDDGRPQGPS